MEQLKKGYKKTEVGVIPEDWLISSIGDILSIKHGKDQKGVQNVNGQYPILGTGGVMGYTDSYLYNKESVLIGRKGTIDKPKFMNNPFWTVDTLFYSEIKNDVFAKYIYYKFLQINWYSYNEASGVPSLNAKTIEGINITIPPTLTEQKAIADALTNVDELITNLEKLIAKKKAIKQGAMQQLLTPPHKGGKRLEGFNGDWVEKTLGEVCNIKKGQLITESTRVNGEVPVIAGGKTPAYFHNMPNRIGKTITVSGSGASAGYVSFHITPIFASDCSTIEENKDYSIEFLFYFLQLMQEEIYRMQTGGAQPHIHPSDLKPIKICLPKLNEQESIAQIIREMDIEIKVNIDKCEKIKLNKQGMMQELLTGKTRLI